MAKDNKDRIARLEKYLEGLKQRLVGEIPERHKGAEEAFKTMLEIDIKKTTLTLEGLKK